MYSVPITNHNVPARSTERVHHLVIVDWDDTIMPTAYLNEHIDFEVDPITKRVRALGLKAESKETADSMARSLTESGSAALRMLKAVYSVETAFGRNASTLIVTNGVAQWLWDSLIIAATLCPIYRQIELLLRAQKTKVIFARNPAVDRHRWKLDAFNLILRRFGSGSPSQSVNVITIGDQWTDHILPLTPSHRMSHHQIKLFPEPNARYLAVELNVAADILEDELATPTLFRFALNPRDEVLIEFEGYHDDESQSDSESLDTPKSVSVCP